MTGRKDPRLGGGTVSSAVLDPERDHRGDRCPATLATRDGQPSQPVAACLSMHAARIPRRTRSSPWATALALGGARGSAQLNWQPKPPVPRTGCQHPPRAGPMCPRWRRAALRGLGHARPHAPAHVAGAAPVSRPRSCHRRSVRPGSGVWRSRPSRIVAASPTALVTGVPTAPGATAA